MSLDDSGPSRRLPVPSMMIFPSEINVGQTLGTNQEDLRA